jgi:glycosyltransferase involved in cell wall biosynthesis
MTILIVNWAWYPSGGDWTAIENLTRLYEQHGHTVVPFSMKHQLNLRTAYDRYFIDNVDYRELNVNRNVSNSFKVLRRSIYSYESRRKLEQLLRDVKVDLAHIHTLGPQITCSILSLLKEHNVPVIWTLHDYGLLCPATSFVRNGRICERCRGNRFFWCTIGKCKKHSYLASLVASLAAYTRQMQHFRQYVDLFICPSQMLYDKYLEFGFEKTKLAQIHNPFDIDNLRRSFRQIALGYGDYILYVGRIEREKGVYSLLRAMETLPEVNLLLAGNGTQLDVCRKLVAASKTKNVCFLGLLTKEEVFGLIQNSLFVVCPSEWYENMPYSIVEAMLLGKTVVGARLGGIPEFVLDGSTGLTFEPGNIPDLADKVNRLVRDKEEREAFGRNAREHMTQLVNFDSHYRRMQEVFKSLNLG